MCHLADVGLPVWGLPSVATPAGETGGHGWCRGLIWGPFCLAGKLGGKLSRVEDYAEHQDEEGVQKVEIVVKEDSSLKKEMNRFCCWIQLDIFGQEEEKGTWHHISPPGQEVRPARSQSRDAGSTNKQTNRSLNMESL